MTPLAIQPVVQIRDAMGITVSSDNSTQVTAAITAGTGTAGATLAGTLTVTAVNGQANFNNIQISLAGTGYTLTFTANPALTQAVSAAFNVSAAAPGGSAPFVPPAPSGTATHYVSAAAGASDTNNGLSPATAWRSLQHAANQAAPGNIIEIANGSYARFTIQNKTATAGSPIVFRASGNAAIIDNGTSSTTSPDSRDAIKIDTCEHVIIHGLRTQSAFRAGCRISSSLHVTVQGCVFADGGTWGLFTDYTDHVKILGNECYGSKREHGIYHSNSGDFGQIIGNYCHNNCASGIQCNGDGSQLLPALGTRGDGWIEQTLIERNLIVDNGGGSLSTAGAIGSGGGAAVNLACARNNVVRNNLILNNFASGIAGSSNGLGAAWGSSSNTILHNTIVFRSGEGRHCLIMKDGSHSWVIRNNVLIAGARGIAEWHSDSISGVSENYNLMHALGSWPLFTNETTSTNYTFAQWKTLTGGGANSINANATFTNAASGDYSLAAGSPGRDQGTNAAVTGTYDGGSRPLGAGYDMGCYER